MGGSDGEALKRENFDMRDNTFEKMVTFEDLDCGSRYTTDDRKACELFGDPRMGSEKIEDLAQFRYPGVEAP